MTKIHYTSWGPRRSGQSAELYAGDDDEKLAEFGVEKAVVGDQTWVLTAPGTEGVSAKAPDGRVFTATGACKAKDVAVDLAGTALRMVNENGSNWVVLTAEGLKIAQFSGADNGVRRSILEFVPDAEDPAGAEAAIAALHRDDVVALSWFARTILEAKLSRTSGALITALIAATILAVLAVFV